MEFLSIIYPEQLKFWGLFPVGMSHGLQGRKELPAISSSSGAKISVMLVGCSSYLDPAGELKFPQLWDHRKEKVLAGSRFIFLCFGNMV